MKTFKVSKWQRLFSKFRPRRSIDKVTFTEQNFPLEPEDQLQPVEEFVFELPRFGDRIYGAGNGIRQLAEKKKQLANLLSVGKYLKRRRMKKGYDYISGVRCEFLNGQRCGILVFGRDEEGKYFTFLDTGTRFNLVSLWLVTPIATST